MRKKQMKLITVSGPPSSGKTSVILNVIKELKNEGIKAGVVKMDYNEPWKLGQKDVNIRW
jgi:Ni2+-binding GTPase involved in maturation of urease and hydrogenase